MYSNGGRTLRRSRNSASALGFSSWAAAHAAPVTALMGRLWQGAAERWGSLRSGTHSVVDLFHSPLSEDLETCMRQWMRQVLHSVPGAAREDGVSRANLQYFVEVMQSEARRPSVTVSDEAVQTAMRSFDMRFAFARGSERRPRARRAQTVGRVLRQCQEDPITFTTLSKHMAHLRKPETLPLRRQLLQRLVELDLGVLETQQRRAPGSAEPLTSLCRSHLTTTRRDLQRCLRFPEACFRPSRQGACASVVTPEADAPMAAGGGLCRRRATSNTGASGQGSRACDIAAAGVVPLFAPEGNCTEGASQPESGSCARSRTIVDGSIASVCIDTNWSCRDRRVRNKRRPS